MSNQQRRANTATRINDPTHARIKEHNRDSETLSATIDRALDAQTLLSIVTGIEDADAVVTSLSLGVARDLTDAIDFESVITEATVSGTINGEFRPDLFKDHLEGELRERMSDISTDELPEQIDALGGD